jgi:hypothetical protein
MCEGACCCSTNAAKRLTSDEDDFANYAGGVDLRDFESAGSGVEADGGGHSVICVPITCSTLR